MAELTYRGEPVDKFLWRDQVYAKLRLSHPEIDLRRFDFDDPWAWQDVVGDVWRYRPRAGDQVLDVGANKGVFTAFCALNKARVTAYEPNPEAFALLLDTVRRNGLGDLIRPVQAAVSDSRGTGYYQGSKVEATGKFALQKTTNGRLLEDGELVGEGTIVAEVPLVTLADAVGDQAWDCVKVDVEGHEFKILPAAPDEVLRWIKFLTVEIHPGWGQVEELLDRLSGTFRVEVQGSSLYAINREDVHAVV